MSNSTVYLDKIYSKDGNTEIVDTVNRSVKAKTIELGGNIIASHSGVEGAGEVTLQNVTLGDSAVPSRSMNFRNKIINGDLRIAQRGTSTLTNPNDYMFDRIRNQNYSGLAPSYTVDKIEDGPAGISTSSMKLTCTNNTTLTNNNYNAISTVLEVGDIRYMGFWENTNQEATFSFWIKANYTGKHTVSFVIMNSSPAQAAGYYKSFTIDVANTWEKKVITIPIQTGITTYANDNERGLVISIVPCASSDRYLSVAEESWTTDETRTAMVASNSKNFCDTVGNTLQTTGWQFEVGSVPTPFEHRPYGVELALCQRYYSIISSVDCSAYYVTGQNAPTFNFSYPQTMRATPAITISRQSNDSTNLSSIVQRNQTPNSFNLYITGTATGMINFGHKGNEATLLMDAEL